MNLKRLATILILLIPLSGCYKYFESRIGKNNLEYVTYKVNKLGCDYAAVFVENHTSNKITLYAVNGTRGRLGDLVAHSGKDVFCITQKHTNPLGDLRLMARQSPRFTGRLTVNTIVEISGSVIHITYINNAFDKPHIIEFGRINNSNSPEIGDFGRLIIPDGVSPLFVELS